MSNRITIEPTEFVNINTNKKEYGVRIFDDYDSYYADDWGDIPDDDLKILTKILIEYNDEIIEFMIKNKMGCFIGEKWYDWGDIEETINEVLS